MTEPILTRVTGPVVTLTINRPEARNAFTYEMYEALASACREASGNKAIRLVIIEGHESAFGSGTDIALFDALKTAEDSRTYEARIEAALSAIETCEKPTVAAIAGACTGGAAIIAACCDLRIGTKAARIGFPIARTLGNCLSAKNYHRLVRLIGEARVKQLVFTASLIDGERAERFGFLTECVADFAALHARMDELRTLIPSLAPKTLTATKRALHRISQQDFRDDDYVADCYTSADCREGMSAFLEKRKPRWRGE